MNVDSTLGNASPRGRDPRSEGAEYIPHICDQISRYLIDNHIDTNHDQS